MSVILTADALADLASIRAHIGEHNPFAATRIAIQIIATCDRLEYLPERGRLGIVPGTRELTAMWPYVIVYRITPAAVEILRIWHGAQDR
ncbi:type II toxin-antitoxin system RelE/ParE family toxin [Inquilinus sp. 2KB_12]|uniref:Plasmid stabilization system protein ParE n=1 Tax=Inquilinus ginsengisoli TaxID=363840 RepID=A0ABU1K0S6_9PROT|nr:type II toxin-antitoxin system RelE/ParE family toxin [Inquilinus ginsengisoli]MDR6294461.1 plasmid stabilization system protein ParE [Inquilinus ginsengisoli]